MTDFTEQPSNRPGLTASADQSADEATVSHHKAERPEEKLQEVREALASAGRHLVEEIRRRQTEVGKLRAELSEKRHALLGLNAELGATRAELGVARAELCATQLDLDAARRNVGVLQDTINGMLNSRSWRLTRIYRAFGAAIQHLLGRAPSPLANLPALTSQSVPAIDHTIGSTAANRPDASALAAAPSEPAEADEDPWSEWPVWTGDESFLTKRFAFTSSITQYELRTEQNAVVILKDRDFLDNIYRRLLGALQPQRILELGFFQGGMPLFLADMVAPEKIVGIDWSAPSDALRQIITDAQLTDTVKLFGGVLQNDTAQIRRILADEFGDQPLDLIIDDASHEYENSKVCFEEFFGYLRPGGKYVIEDWGWLHWPGEAWQSNQSHFWGKPAMTNLLFEVIMASASTFPGIIAKIEILSWACIVITRGNGLGYRERINLADIRLTSGRTFVPL